MAQSIHNDVLDTALDHMRTTATHLVVCANAPTSYADARGAQKLAETGVTAGVFSLAAGSPSGRRLAVAQTTATASAGGNATHVALVAEATSRLLYVTSCPAKTLTSGDVVTVSAWTIDISAPA
jgi:hypothetical protein